MNDLLEELENLPNKYREVAIKAATAEANFKNLSEQSKNMLASLKGKHEGSDVERERLARCSDEWILHSQALADARHDYLVVRSHLNALQVKFETLRSLNSRHVAEINLR